MNKNRLPLIILKLLEEESSETHFLSTPYIQSYLFELGYDVTRQTIASYIKMINELYSPIHFVKKNNEQGYWIEHKFTPAEITFLRDSIQASSAISKKKSDEFIKKIDSLLSYDEQNQLPESIPANFKTDNQLVLSMIGQILLAIQHAHPIYFRYFDWDITKQKKYRKRETFYRIPYAVVSYDGKYYCVMYSTKHKGFANFRIDKMDNLEISKEVINPIHFNLKDWLQSSFQMYSGKNETIIITFDLSMANIVFDQFGKDILIIKTSDQTFTAAIHSSITPTLISWLMMFYDKITVESPIELINQMKIIANDIIIKYKNGGSHGR